MINILTIKNTYNINKIYIDSLIQKYPLINLILLDSDNDDNDDNINEKIFIKLTDHKILYSNNIIFHEINEEFIHKFNDMSLYKYNIYLFNLKDVSFNDKSYYNFLKKYNINIIDYSLENIIHYLKKNKIILEKHLSFYNNVHYLPLQLNDINFKNSDIDIDTNTNYKLCALSLDFDINNIENKNINVIKMKYFDINRFNKEVFYYNIIYIDEFIDKYNNNCNNNDCNNNECNNNMEIPGFYYEYIVQKCILNRVIVIINKNININPIYKKYVIELNGTLIPYFINNIIENYYNIYNDLYKEFYEIELNNIIENIKIETDNTLYNIINRNRYGFIMIRHVNSLETNKYWIESYNCIRKFYFNKIIIIDDNSNKEYLNENDHNNLINCCIINSEYPKRGEILAYYYLIKYNLFDKAVILHDSTFINKNIDFFKYDKVKFLWHFTHNWDTPEDEIKLLKKIKNNKELFKLYQLKNKWMGCFGLQTVIEYSFLKNIVSKYNLFDILNYIDTRPKRMNLERILGLIFTYENPDLIQQPSIYGIIHHYIHWGYSYNKYLNESIPDLDIIKVWTGR